jgi:hypothetical protein
MDQTAVEDLNRKLAELTTPLWFTATAREIPPDPEETPPGDSGNPVPSRVGVATSV